MLKTCTLSGKIQGER